VCYTLSKKEKISLLECGSDNDDTNYLRSDHEEGVWVKEKSKKKRNLNVS
jgi:hypothetical protein